MSVGIKRELSVSVISTIIGGGMLAFFFFLLSDVFFSPHNLSGRWEMIVTIKETRHKPFKGLKMYFIVTLQHHGEELFGTSEKEMEAHNNGSKVIYGGSDRTLSEIKGNVIRKYIFSDTATLHFTENGKKRTSSTLQSLTIHGPNRMSGIFHSTSNSSGIVEWKKSI